jgi:aminoglycoside phosphotransferase (APT) family kinase protein
MANPMPAAELDVTAGLVRRLLAAQHQDLAALPVEPLASGWDNVLFRVGDDLIARLPRRLAGVALLANETRWLPQLAPRLPLPVPVPLRAGQPGEGYPWPWSIVAYQPGTSAADGPPLDLVRAAADLGGFYGALHAPAPPDAPANPFRGVPLARRLENFDTNLATVAAQVDGDAVRAAWSAALAVPAWDGTPRWLQGDPHPANLVVRDGRVGAVLDFGDITAGDPASDLCVAWMMLPGAHHGAFRAAYAAAGNGAASADTWARARGWALNLAIIFLAFSADNPWMRAIGERTLAAVLAEAAAS